MNIEKKKSFIINFFYFVILFGLSVLAVRFVLPALFPFAIALLVTLLLRPLVNLAVKSFASTARQRPPSSLYSFTAR